jgi:replication factor A1
MIKLPYEEIVAKIVEEAGISEVEVNDKIEEKLQQLSGLVSKEGAAHILANELGIKLLEQESSGKVVVNKLLPGMRSVEFMGKVQKVFDAKSFDKGTRKGRVQSFVAGDETGTIRVVAWNDLVEKIQTLKEGDIVHIENAYIKENNNQKELHLNDKSKVELNPPGETIGEVKVVIPSRNRKKIDGLKENDINVEILGTIVQTFEPRYYEVCPQCNKRARIVPGGVDFICEAHGRISPKYAYVLNVVIDDGSGTIRTVFFKNQAENLTKKSEQEMVSMKDNQQKIEQLKNELLGEIVKVVGRAAKNTMFDRLEFVSQLVFINPDPEEELRRLEQ